MVISEQAGIFFESALHGMRGGRASVAMCQDAVFATAGSIRSLQSGHHTCYAVLAKTSLQTVFTSLQSHWFTRSAVQWMTTMLHATQPCKQGSPHI
jgi:hypothetical protein